MTFAFAFNQFWVWTCAATLSRQENTQRAAAIPAGLAAVRLFLRTPSP